MQFSLKLWWIVEATGQSPVMLPVISNIDQQFLCHSERSEESKILVCWTNSL